MTRGLSSAGAQARLAHHGENVLPATPPEPAWRRLLRQFQSPLIYILLGALLLDTGIWLVERGGVPIEAIAIAIILLLNAGLGVWQERRAEDALHQLKELAAPQVRVYRDGTLTSIPGAQLVPGDLLRLEAGDRIPADATAHQVTALAVDESVVTGESVPLDKRDNDPLLAGTLVVRGTTDALVTQTGRTSNLGRLATMLGDVQQEKTPLEKRLATFGNKVARLVIALAVVIAIVGIAVEGLGHAGHVVLFAVALAVAAVPEGLPAVLTLTLALGVERMARRKAVVRRLSAVEALGSVTVIASDKTGTLTENRLEVRRLDAPDPDGALRALVLASDADPGAAVGDPLELALMVHATDAGMDVPLLRRTRPRVGGRPFDADAGFMRVSVREPAGTVSYLKGAPEVVLARCALPDAERADWLERVEAGAAEGFRVLGAASGDGERESDLTWLGLVFLLDPPRPEVAEAMAQARAAGIRVMMLTGDHPATALTVARMAGVQADQVITGDAFRALSPAGRTATVASVNVFARVHPEDKLAIVELLKASGEVVAVTGDGVNDAPALKRADVGIAMGQRGSDVAREVADLVLLDDNFATIVAAIEEGRGIYENIQKFIRFLFSTNLSEVLVVTVGAVAAFVIGVRDASGQLLLPLTAAQLLWINLVTDGAPALALGLDRNPGVMQRPPRDPKAQLLDAPSLRFILTTGSIKAMVAFGILGLLPIVLAASPEVTRTATFLFLAAGQLLFAYTARHTDLVPRANPWLHIAVGAGIAVQGLVLVIPALRLALDAVPIPGPVGIWVAVSMLVSWGLAELVTRVIWRAPAPTSRPQPPWPST
ncbi:MAG: cation-translocating P-type ATPase [Gemmatimonadales bacterium]